ncbi:MAG TPA: DEAD/DEAH box helicase family protein [Telluria sp.]
MELEYAPNSGLSRITPRPFQVSAREALRNGFVEGHRCQMVMSPTGSGKTILAMFLINEALMRGKRAIFVADRRTLINQTSHVADTLGLSHGVLMADSQRYDQDNAFQIASAQTLAMRQWPKADLIIVDEAHAQLSVWTEHIQKCKAAVIGLSATPFSKGLGRLFTNLVNATTMADLTESGVLVPMRVLSCTKVDMKGATTAGGEWTDTAAGARGMKIIGNVVQEWIRYADNRKTIVFGATIDHCESMCRAFIEAGVMAALFTSRITDAERAALLKDYQRYDSVRRVLISVEALAKGFDVPDVGCVCDVRPLQKSLSTAIQMWDRGLRASPSTGKTDMLLLDFSGNIVRFSEDFEAVYHDGLASLDMGEKLDKEVRKDPEDTEPKDCPKCHFKPFLKRCMSCGFEVLRDNLLLYQEGRMVDFKVGRPPVGDKASVWAQCVTLMRQSRGRLDTAPNRAAHFYKSITGVYPLNLPDFHSVADVVVTRGVQNKHKANQIAYRRTP